MVDGHDLAVGLADAHDPDVELVKDSDSKTPAPELAKAVVDAAFERGLLLLSCGTYGNVLRTLVPLVVTDEELEQGLRILEESLADASAHVV